MPSMAEGLALAEGPAMAEGSGNPPLSMVEVDRLSEQYGKEARYTELIRLGRQALEQGMEFLALHQRMAMAYRALGRFEGAVSHDQRALEMHPSSSEIRSRLYNDLM
ncbi:MAG: tetratricopeptide repeat protein, partial [Bacteroidota bacterium]